MGTASDAPAPVAAVAPPATPEPKRPWFLSFVLVFGMIATPLRCLAYIMGTPQTQGTPAWFGVLFELLGFYVMLSVWRWRRWAVWLWAANSVVTLGLGLADGDHKGAMQGAVQCAVLFFVVRPIWSNFRSTPKKTRPSPV